VGLNGGNCMKIINDFFKGIKKGILVGKKGGIMDIMWCASCRAKQPVYLDGSILRCTGCDKVIDARCGPGTIDVDVKEVD
jgi:hypothetical protein